MATPAARSQSFPRSQKPALQREGFFSRLKRRLRIGSKGSYSVGESLEVTPASGQYVARSSTLESVQRLNRADSDMGHHLVSSLVDGSESSESMVCVRSSPGACHPQRQATEKDSSAESLNKRKHQHKRSIRTEQLPALPSADKQTDSRNYSRSNHEAQRTGLAQSGEVVDNTFLLQEEKAIDLDDDVFKRDNPAPSMTGEDQRVVGASRASSGPDIPEDPGYETLEDQRVAPARVVGASRDSSGPDIPEDPGYETLEDIRKQIQQEERQKEGGEKMKLEKENVFDPESFDDMGSGPGYETLDEIQKQVLEKRSEAGISVDCRLGSGAMTGQNSKTSLDSGLGSPDPQNGSPETLSGQSGSPETLGGHAGAGPNTCAARMVSSFHTVRSAQRSDMLNFYEAEDDIYANSQIPIRKKSVKKSQSEPNNVSGTEASGNNRCSVLSKPSAQNDVSGTDASGNNRCSVLSKPTTQNEKCPSEKECSDVGSVASVTSDGGETMRELQGGGASPSTPGPPPLPVRKYSRSDLEGFDCESSVISPDGKAASPVLGPCASSGSTPACNTGFPILSVQIIHANNLGSTKHESSAEEKCVNREVELSRESGLRNTEVKECTERTGSAVPSLQHTETAGSLLSPSNCPQSTNGGTDIMQRDRGTTVVQSACDGETKCRDCLVTDSDCVAGTRSGAHESPCDTESAQSHEGNPRTPTACVKTAFDGSLIPGSRLDSITRVKCRSNSRRGDKTEVEVCRGKVKLKGDIDGYVPLTSHIDTGKEDIDGRVPLASHIHTGNTGTNSYCSSPLRGLASSQHSPAAAGTSHAQGNSAQSSQPRGNSAQSSQPEGNSAQSSQPCAHRKQRAGGKDSNTKSPGCDALTSRLDSFTSEGTSCANGAHSNSGVTSAQVNTSVNRDTVCVSTLVDPLRETGTPNVCVSDDRCRETRTPDVCVSDDTHRETGTPNVCVSDDNDSIFAEYSSDAEPIHMSLREVFGDRDLPAQSPIVAGKKERTQIDTAAALAFQESMQQLKECGWYWGPLSHGEAETKLANKPDGSFLVRDSANENYILTLSFRSSGKVYHTRIEHFKGKFGFWSQPESHGKTTIKDFIEQAMENSRNGVFKYFLRAQGPGLPPIAMHLLYPVSRFKTMRSLMHMCRFQVLQYVRRDHVDSLPIPPRIKDYLREHQYYAEIIDDAVNDVVGFDDNANEVTQL